MIAREVTEHQVSVGIVDRVLAGGAVSAGGASSRYVIGVGDSESDGVKQCLAVITFQNGNPATVGRNGVTLEALLAVSLDRLKAFQAGPFPSDYNAAAIHHIDLALAALKMRQVEQAAKQKKAGAVA